MNPFTIHETSLGAFPAVRQEFNFYRKNGQRESATRRVCVKFHIFSFLLPAEQKYFEAFPDVAADIVNALLYDVEDTAELLREMNIREEDEVTVCELFDRYTRKGLSEGLNQGIEAAIAICRELGLSFEVTAEKIKEKFRMGDAEVQRSMKQYW